MGARWMILGAVLASMTTAAAADDATSPSLSAPVDENVMLSAIRVEGYRCAHASGAVKDMVASTPLEPAWIVTCESGRYRVTFLGDAGIRVEPLD
jgi:hypothetical protein